MDKGFKLKCPTCTKKFDRSSGLTRHEEVCKGKNLQSSKSRDDLPWPAQTESKERIDEGHLQGGTDQEVSVDSEDEIGFYKLNLENELSSPDPEDQLPEPNPNDELPDPLSDPQEQWHGANEPEYADFLDEKKGTSQTSGATRIETFENESAGRAAAGEPQLEERIPAEYDKPRKPAEWNPQRPWAPFPSQKAYKLWLWFCKDRTSQRMMREYLKDPDFNTELITDKENAMTYDDYIRCINTIPFGIPGDDKWLEKEIKIPLPDGREPVRTKVLFRDIKSVIEFLLSHRPFAKETAWAPVKQYHGVDDIRCYNEMHTADWWWEMQEKLPGGATVVPVMIGSDKTLMTQHRGDVTAWPVYLTVGNLSRKARSSQSVSSVLLVGFVPIPKATTRTKSGRETDLAHDVKVRLYHMAMDIILSPLKKFSKKGIFIHCSDDKIRKCYPIISNMVADYEEFVMITHIRSGRQCPNCLVPSDKRDNLMKQHKPRTHQQMWKQINSQNPNKKDSDQWVHPEDNFGWNYPHADIYASCSLDLLHQFWKGIFTNMIDWLMAIIDGYFPASRKSKYADKTKAKVHGAILLDERFRQVPSFPGLKHFPSFSNITQWTGQEMKQMARILVSVVTPLLLASHAKEVNPFIPEVLEYVKAICDFAMIVEYKTHDEDSLELLESTIKRIDMLKVLFKDQNFNYPKFHATSHYPASIRKMGAPDNHESHTMEIHHRVDLKAFFDWTNKIAGEWQKQLAEHSFRRARMLALSSVVNHGMEKMAQMNPTDIPIEPYITKMNATPVDLDKHNWEVQKPKRRSLITNFGLKCKNTTTALDIQRDAKLPGLVDALAVFVLAERAKQEGKVMTDEDLEKRATDSSWAADFPVQVFGSLRCWYRTGKNYANTEEKDVEYLRCTPSWRKGGERKDYCWVQEYSYSDFPSDEILHDDSQENPSNPQRIRKRRVQNTGKNDQLRGRNVGQLQLLISIRDLERVTGEYEECLEYHGALIDILPVLNQGKVNPEHGMIELGAPKFSQAKKDTTLLHARRVYGLQSIIRAAHIIPGKADLSNKENTLFYVNNYIDWDHYQLFAEDDWLTAREKKAGEIYTMITGQTYQNDGDQKEYTGQRGVSTKPRKKTEDDNEEVDDLEPPVPKRGRKRKAAESVDEVAEPASKGVKRKPGRPSKTKHD